MTRDVVPTGEIVERSAVRLLLVSGVREVLLLHYITPDTDQDFWCTPGGALDPGEDDAAAVIRELHEELGWDANNMELGPVVATREDVFVIGDGRTFHQHERFYLIRTAAFAPRPAALSAFEQEAWRGHRWWGLGELRTTEEDVSPRRLAELVTALLDNPAGELPLAAGR